MTSRPRGGLTAALLTLALTASALAGAPAAVAAPPAAAPAAAAISSPLGIERVADADRYSTAVAVSKHAFPSARGGTVFIASGVVYPDALSAAPAQQAVEHELSARGQRPAWSPAPDRGVAERALLYVRGRLGWVGLGQLDRPLGT